ncbi:Transcription-repair-coupling factor OS=Lysinibacillus sphaericus OX=1421 GN=mfd PE=3 SV=1 [Lysinibacillus sphaericus]
MEHSGALVREAIEREMARGGQVFYLYNRVEDMARKVEEIQMLVRKRVSAMLMAK